MEKVGLMKRLEKGSDLEKKGILMSWLGKRELL